MFACAKYVDNDHTYCSVACVRVTFSHLAEDADAVEAEDRPAGAAAADGSRHDHEAHEARRHPARHERGEHPCGCKSVHRINCLARTCTPREHVRERLSDSVEWGTGNQDPQRIFIY